MQREKEGVQGAEHSPLFLQVFSNVPSLLSSHALPSSAELQLQWKSVFGAAVIGDVDGLEFVLPPLSYTIFLQEVDLQSQHL